MAQAPPPPVRIGSGYDIHRFGAGRPLVLGGVRFEDEPGLVGHSDADVVLHAVIDALLGAAGLGDIGAHFPTDDPRFKDVDSLVLLRHTAGEILRAGFCVLNLDVTVIAEHPRIRPRVDEMRAAIAGALGVAVEQVSVKGKTNEGLDAVGRGEAVAAWAVALVARDGPSPLDPLSHVRR
jgi:2-C-methyl-D-erythritol 2,4-cyclodiphosphate synthase